MKNQFGDCYSFILNLAKELSLPYDTQYQNMVDFARWNLPEEIALEWIDAEGMIKILEASGYLSDDALGILQTILRNFALKFQLQDNSSWTHDAMRNDTFWNKQRSLALEAVNLMNNLNF